MEGKIIGKINLPLTTKSFADMRRLCLTQKPQLIQLKEENMVAIVKICREHEGLIYEIIANHKILPPNSFPHVYSKNSDMVIFKKILPHGDIKTFKDLLNARKDTGPALKQIVALLIHAQQKDPRFAHNDLKADNILITDESGEIQIGDKKMDSHGMRVVFIDFETVTGTLFPRFKAQMSRETLLEYSLEESMPYSSWTDLHLVMMEMNQYGISLPLPQHLFQTKKQGNPLVTGVNRLNTEGRLHFNSLLSLDELFETL